MMQQCFRGGFPYIIDFVCFLKMFTKFFKDEDTKMDIINEAIRKYSDLEEQIVLGVRGDEYQYFFPTENKCGIMSISQLRGLPAIAKRANCLDKILKFVSYLSVH